MRLRLEQVLRADYFGLRRLRDRLARPAGLLVRAGAAMAAGARADEVPRCATALTVETVLQLLNTVRAQGRNCGSTPLRAAAGPALVWNEGLADAALRQSNEMARLRRMSHRDGENRDLAQRLNLQGYRFVSAVENVAVGYGSLPAVVEAWLDSAGHCENLMNGGVLELGLACVDGASTEPSDERRYWTLVLAAPPRAAQAPREEVGRYLSARREPIPAP